MDWWIILIIVLSSLLVIFLSFSFIAGGIGLHKLLFPETFNRKVCFDTDVEKGLIDEQVKTWEKKQVTFKGYNDYEIHGEITLHDPKKWVVFAHGYTWAREGGYKYMKLFDRLGFSMLTYDARGHGDNVKTAVTLGYFESKDLSKIIDSLREQYGEDIVIGLHGESMGAATVLETLNYQKNLSFIIADSPFADMRMLMKIQVKRFIPLPYLVYFSDIILKMKYHFSMKDVQPRKSVIGIDTPILLIQGSGDTLIPPKHTQMIKEAGNDIELTYFPDVDHTDSYFSFTKEYEERELQFLKEHKII